ncbi:hypothetical protein DICVIV_08780 [Dictyocaulus viviparus]|uniref:CNH domain-containing protein n=1 Tax=Dictyocaulus viviparus TaxID=29172 RepID=A0A0D8XS01_DICVI|nr:hypothetical protein DICVIV_08780 [Dictyocaulus viviparus]
MTRDLLDKVNNGSSTRLLQRTSQDEHDGDSSAEEEIIRSLCDELTIHLDGIRLGVDKCQRHEVAPSTSSSCSSNTPSSGAFHSDRTLPARDLPPLPDVVSGDALLHDGNGVIDDDKGTLIACRAAPQFLRVPKNSIRQRSSSLENSDAVRLRLLIGCEAERPKTYFGVPVTPKVSGLHCHVRLSLRKFDLNNKQVVMGACFTKMLHECSLRINCAGSWVHPSTGAQILLLGCEEGIYAVDTSKLHDGELTKIHHRRCSWLHVHQDVLMAMQGRTSYLYRWVS